LQAPAKYNLKKVVSKSRTVALMECRRTMVGLVRPEQPGIVDLLGWGVPLGVEYAGRAGSVKRFFGASWRNCEQAITIGVCPFEG
jgi:hypothetical protein